MTAECLMGQEAEIACAAFGADGSRADQSLLMNRLMRVAASEFVHLPTRGGSGIFFPNAGKLYVDCGKPEYCTPEVTDPAELCRFARAGELMLLRIGKRISERSRKYRHVVFNRANISYGPNAATWGCHESYGHRADETYLATQLISHLVSRPIYSGSGGFDVNQPGIHFSLSPRVSYIRSVRSDSSQSNRGIFHTKHKHLNRSGYLRLHVICGENVSSSRSLFLKYGVTALIVRLIEQQVEFGDIHLANPTEAMLQFALDPTLTAEARTLGGEAVSALQLQRRYLRIVEQHVDESYMPEWATTVTDTWRDTLSGLERADESTLHALDWPLKRSIFEQHLIRSSTDWNQIDLRNRVLSDWWTKVSVDNKQQLTIPAHFCTQSDVKQQLTRLTPRLRAFDLSADDILQTVALRDELFELDLRFGELGDDGIFNRLNNSGVLGIDSLSDPEKVEEAVSNPPPGTRALLRGRAIQQLGTRPDKGACDWSAVWDLQNNKVLNLSDPFATQSRWQDVEREDESLGSLVRGEIQQGLNLYDQGYYEEAMRVLQRARRLQPRFFAGSQLARYLAWTLARRADPTAPAILAEIHQGNPNTLLAICDYVYVYRFLALVPGPDFDNWIQRGLEIINRNPEDQPERMVPLLGHRGFQLLCRGENQAALETFEEASRSDRLSHSHWRANARVHAEHAEACRRLQLRERAKDLLEKAKRIHDRYNCQGDLSEFTLPTLAKLEVNRDRAAAIGHLQQALQIQRRQKNFLGELKTLILLARTEPQTNQKLAAAKRKILTICAELPLANCPKLREITEKWGRWTSPSESDISQGDYWCL